MDFTIFKEDNITKRKQIIYIEIKPHNQTYKPKRGTKRYQQRLMVYLVNKAKWDAVNDYIHKQNQMLGYEKYKFNILTEKNFNFGKITSSKKKSHFKRKRPSIKR